MLLATGKASLIGSSGVAVSDGGRPVAAAEGPGAPLARSPGMAAAAIPGVSEALPIWRDPAASARTADIVAILTAASLPWAASLAGFFSAVWLMMPVPTLEPEALPSALLVLAVCAAAAFAIIVWQSSPQLQRTVDRFARDPRLYREQNLPTLIGLLLARKLAEVAGLLCRGTVLFHGDGRVNWIGLVVMVQIIVTSPLKLHLFDFHEGWMYVIGVGVAGGMLLQSRSAEARRGTGKHPGMNAGMRSADELSAGRCALKNPPAVCSRSIT